MNKIYRYTFHVEATQCDPFQRMRLSRLAEIMQDCSIAHTVELGVTKDMTLGKGLLWVTARQHISFVRMPRYDETVTIETWPGRMMHVLFPRYTRIKVNEEVIGTASALWLLMDAHTRQMVFPDQYGIAIEGEEDKDIALPGMVRAVKKGLFDSCTIRYSYCDLNGHLNNARYFDLGMDVIPECEEGLELQNADIDYVHEITSGKKVDLIHHKEDGREYISGFMGSTTAFRMALGFKEK